MSYILGVSGYFHDSSVCLLRDGQLIEFVKEEFLTRIKGTRGFPSRSLNFLIKKLTSLRLTHLFHYLTGSKKGGYIKMIQGVGFNGIVGIIWVED